MKKTRLSAHPVFNNNPFDTVEVLNVVCYHYHAFCLCRTAYKQVKVLQFLSQFLQSDFLLTKDVNRLCKRNGFHFLQEVINGNQILLSLIAIIRPVTQLHNCNVRNKAACLSTLFHAFNNAVFISKGKNANIGVKKITFHNSTSFMCAFLASRMSSMISSVGLSSCHLPAKLSVQSSSVFRMEVLSKDISSSLTSLLRSFNVAQYRALVGDGVVNVLVFMSSMFLGCKNTYNN